MTSFRERKSNLNLNFGKAGSFEPLRHGGNEGKLFLIYFMTFSRDKALTDTT